MIETISETGKTHEDAKLMELIVTAESSASGPSTRKKYLADEGPSAPLAVAARRSPRYAPLGLVGVIGPWNYPSVNAFSDASRL